MTLNLGRVSVWIKRGRATRPKGELGKRFQKGPYGSWRFNPIDGPWFVLSAWRRYPDDRLRCQRCGYRKNDAPEPKGARAGQTLTEVGIFLCLILVGVGVLVYLTTR